MSEANKEVIRNIEACWNAGRVAELEQYFAPSFVAHASIPGMPPTLETGKMAHGMAMQAFPDRKGEIVEMIAEGDKVFIRNRITGTNRGGAFWLGVPEPNNKSIDFESWSVYRLDNGKVVESWGLNDGMLAMIQLGSLQPPMPAPAR
jgi:predicted ester cyclase